LAAISAVTNAVKSLANNGIKLIGYNGVMLPVMEDLILADRAAQDFPTFSLRDLLVFSSVCGVGLDTVPVPGEITFISPSPNPSIKTNTAPNMCMIELL
jgi:uncharacterized protein (UPF0210 family)